MLISINMKKNIEQQIEFPAGMDFSFSNGELVVKGKGKEVKRTFLQNPKISMEKKNNSFVLKSEKATKRELKLLNSIAAHVRNIVHGIEEDYLYKLEVCNVHFPVTVKLEGNLLKIKNFLGEKIDRTSEILPNVKVVVKGNQIEVSSPDIEAAGQTAARMEIATKIRNRDRRVFQDGIFITQKPGRESKD